MSNQTFFLMIIIIIAIWFLANIMFDDSSNKDLFRTILLIALLSLISYRGDSFRKETAETKAIIESMQKSENTKFYLDRFEVNQINLDEISFGRYKVIDGDNVYFNKHF